MEAGLVDGEEAATIQSDYVQASCTVTSSTARMSFDTGEIDRTSPFVLFSPARLGASFSGCRNT